MPQCWQQGPQKPLLGVVRAAPCWTQLIPVAANIPSQGISEPHSQGGGTAGKVYLGNRILKTFFFFKYCMTVSEGQVRNVFISHTCYFTQHCRQQGERKRREGDAPAAS